MRVQENPFHERAAALRADSRTQASSTGNAVLGAESAGLSDPLSADRIEQQLASLAGLPEYIRKLERRERAAQKSAETKAKKIVRLEEELQRCVWYYIWGGGHLFVDGHRCMLCVLGFGTPIACWRKQSPR